MRENASTPRPANRPPSLSSALGALLAFVLLALVGFAGSASARPLAKDGKIHACYRVKGKPKGAMRVVRSTHSRCRRGERKVSWAISGGAQSASAGAAGKDGAAASSDESNLKAQVEALSLRVQTLEGTLQKTCEQSEALTEQVNLLAEVVEGLGLNGALTGIGGLLMIPALPEPLAPFTCPTG